jgi:ParB-like chromosome segregation protein Spo0J
VNFTTALRIANIIVPLNRRPVRDGDVRRLADSIRELGLINPITVQPDDKSKKLVLVTGANRLAACKSLGWTEIAGFVVSYDTLLCDLAEIDENLCRAELTPAQRAEATAKRKVIWEQIHPDATAEAKRAEGGKTAGRGRPKGPAKSAEPNAPSAFTKETAARTGRSERSVRVDAQIGAALRESPEAAAIVESAPKPLPQAELLKVAQAPKEERPKVAAAAVEKAKAPKPKRKVHPRVAGKSETKAEKKEEVLSPDPTLGRYAIEVAQVTATLWQARTSSRPVVCGEGETDIDALASLVAELRRLRT